jgi:hypothetical protein
MAKGFNFDEFKFGRGLHGYRAEATLNVNNTAFKIKFTTYRKHSVHYKKSAG